MNHYLVRRPDLCWEWEDAARVSSHCATDAAQEFSADHCARDPERYQAFESGVLIEVKDLDTGEVLEVEVTMHSNPVFRANQRR